jgi:hypothetical protein
MADRVEVLESLRSVLQRAKFRHEQAESAFYAVAAQSRQLPRLPGCLQPIGAKELRDAFSAELKARQLHIEALHKFNYFAIQSTLPMQLETAPMRVNSVDSLPASRAAVYRAKAGKSAQSETAPFPVLKRAS